MDKKITWEDSEIYVIVHHHDEHIDDELGLCHRLQIIDIGSIIELHDRRNGAVPQHYSSTESTPPKRTTRISGLTRTILPTESFREWWGWFRRDKSRPIVVISDVEEVWIENHMSCLIEQSASIEFRS